MKQILQLLLISICVKAQVNAQSDAVQILKKSEDALKKVRHLEYNATFKAKYADNKDTIFSPGYNCSVTINPADTIVGYFAKVINTSKYPGATDFTQVEWIYDGDAFYSINYGNKSILKAYPHLDKGALKFTQKNIHQNVVPWFFYKDSPFLKNLEETAPVVTGEVKVNDIACWKIEIKRNISAPVTSRSDYLFIDKITFLPVRFEIHATWENIQSEYQQLTLKYAKIEEKAPPNRYTPVYPPQYNVEIFTTPLFDYSLLASGTSAPVFDYRDLKGVNYNLKKLKSSKLILLDFWYLGCAPCLASMPEIVSLVQQYKDKGLVVLGINPFDKEDEKKELIQKLVQRKGINYPLLIADNKIVEHYRVKIYPTTYLIAEGKILYANYGYSKESIERLGKIIEEFMGKNFTN